MLFLVGSNALAQPPAPGPQEVTITTYYPAPYGVYSDMIVTQRQSIGDVNLDGSFNSGDMAVDSSGNPMWGSLTVAGNVGIGTTNPGANKLEVVGGPIKATGGLIVQTVANQTAENNMTKVDGQMWLRSDINP